MIDETELLEYIYNNFVDKNQVLFDANDLDRALYLAAENGYLPIVKFLVKKGAGCLDWALTCAAKKEHLNIVEFLKKEIKKREGKDEQRNKNTVD